MKNGKKPKRDNGITSFSLDDVLHRALNAEQRESRRPRRPRIVAAKLARALSARVEALEARLAALEAAASSRREIGAAQRRAEVIQILFEAAQRGILRIER